MTPDPLLFAASLFLLLPFLWFIAMGKKTFRVPAAPTAASRLGPLLLLSGLAFGMWASLNGAFSLQHFMPAAALALASIALYESARRVIRDRGFSIAMTTDVPQAVCADGPYALLRHPVYASYLLAFLAMLVAFPAAISAALFVINAGFFVYAALAEERVLAHSPLASNYADYRRRVGMFLPRFTRAASARGS